MLKKESYAQLFWCQVNCSGGKVGLGLGCASHFFCRWFFHFGATGFSFERNYGFRAVSRNGRRKIEIWMGARFFGRWFFKIWVRGFSF